MEPEGSSPHSHPNLTSWSSILILSSHLRLGLPSIIIIIIIIIKYEAQPSQYRHVRIDRHAESNRLLTGINPKRLQLICSLARNEPEPWGSWHNDGILVTVEVDPKVFEVQTGHKASHLISVSNSLHSGVSLQPFEWGKKRKTNESTNSDKRKQSDSKAKLLIFERQKLGFVDI